MEQQLSELQLIQCSLLPDEHLALIDSFWKKALENYADYELPAFLESMDLDIAGASSASFELKVDGVNIWFQVTLTPPKASGVGEGDISELQPATISVKGENITRAEQEHWQCIIAQMMEEIGSSEYVHLFPLFIVQPIFFPRFPVYQLLSLHLLPRLRENINSVPQGNSSGAPLKDCTTEASSNSVIYHALFTSHHLVSPNKRRSLQHWSSSLSLTGFAKVGHPGVIYAEGARSDIEEFVGNVKGMQWLGLKVRFVEPLELIKYPNRTERQWMEFQKVGEVVEEMRGLGREDFVVEMGIGSLGSRNSSHSKG